MIESTTSDAAQCPIWRSVDVLGQKWAILILREALLGRTRFAEFRARLGVASDVLTQRLDSLVDHGLMERQSYREPGERARAEYVLTTAGREVVPVLAALGAWGEAFIPYSPDSPVRTVDVATGEPVRIAFVDAAGREVTDVRFERTPVAA